MANARTLLVEDDRRLGALLTDLLSLHGITVDHVTRGDVALQRIIEEKPDLVILDIGLPGIDGIEVCKRARAGGYAGKILMLTARSEEADEVAGLDVGADDYVTKSVSTPRLLARIRVLLRRESGQQDEESIQNGSLVILPTSRSVALDGRAVELTTAEYDLLRILAREVGRVVTRDRLVRTLQGYPYDGVERSVDLLISRLRRQLGDDVRHPRWIKTVRGVGYMLAKQP